MLQKVSRHNSPLQAHAITSLVRTAAGSKGAVDVVIALDNEKDAPAAACAVARVRLCVCVCVCICTCIGACVTGLFAIPMACLVYVVTKNGDKDRHVIAHALMRWCKHHTLSFPGLNGGQKSGKKPKPHMRAYTYAHTHTHTHKRRNSHSSYQLSTFVSMFASFTCLCDYLNTRTQSLAWQHAPIDMYK